MCFFVLFFVFLTEDVATPSCSDVTVKLKQFCGKHLNISCAQFSMHERGTSSVSDHF